MSQLFKLSGGLKIGSFPTSGRPPAEVGSIYFDTTLGRYQVSNDGVTYQDLTPSTSYRYVRIVDFTAGDDSTGDGSSGKPFKTISGALASITDNSSSNRYLIKVEAKASWTEPSGSLVLKPFCSIEGSGSQDTVITGTAVTYPSSNTAADRLTISGLTLSGGSTSIDTTGCASGMQLTFKDVRIAGAVSIDGNSQKPSTIIKFQNCELLGGGQTLTATNCYSVNLVGVTAPVGSATLALVNSNVSINGSQLAGVTISKDSTSALLFSTPSPDYTIDQIMYVRTWGSDGYSTGGPEAPSKTIGASLAAITDASASKPYLIDVGPGVFAETSIQLKPWVFIKGKGAGVTQVYLPGSANVGAVAPFASDARSGMSDLTLGTLADPTGIAIDLSSDSGTNRSFEFSDITFATVAGMGCNSYDDSDFFHFRNVDVAGSNASFSGTGLIEGMRNALYFTLDTQNPSSAITANNYTIRDSQATHLIVSCTDGKNANPTILSTVLGSIGLYQASTGVTNTFFDAASLKDIAPTLSGSAVYLSRLETAKGIAFAPTTPSDWTTSPVLVQSALDELATRTISGLSSSLAQNHIFVGNSSGIATDVAMSGEASIVSSGAITLSNDAVIGKLLTAYSAASGSVSSSDSILSAIEKIDGNDALKLPLAGGTMSGAIAMGAHKITGLADPTADQDAATKYYTDTTFIPLSEIGAANGVAALDSGGKVPFTQLPSTLMIYKGAWNASTNSPSLADGTGVVGWVYRASVAGTQNLGSGSQTWAVGDFAIYNGSIWQHSPAADGVSSVNGFTGAVVLSTTDIAEGTNLYYTDVRAQAAITGGASSIVTSNLTASRALVSDGSGKVAVSSVSATELGYLAGVTSGIQSQLNGKQATGNYITDLTGEVSASGPGSASATISNAAVIAKVLTGYSAAAGTVSSSDSILSAIQKLDGNDGLKLAKALAQNHIFVGSAGGVAIDVAMSGEASIVSSGAVTLSNGAVIAKVLTGFTSGAGTVSASDSILSAIQKLDGNIALKQDALTFGNLTEATSSVLTITGGTGAVIGSGASIQVKQASGSQSGFLSSTDWTTFNGKISAVVQDTAPQLGGNLDLNSKKVLGTMQRAAVASPSAFIEQEYLTPVTLTASTTAAVSGLGFAVATYAGHTVDYKIVSSVGVRIGRLRTVTDGTVVSIVDDFNETADIGISWSAAYSAGNVSVSYANASAANGTASFDIKRFLA